VSKLRFDAPPIPLPQAKLGVDKAVPLQTCRSLRDRRCEGGVFGQQSLFGGPGRDRDAALRFRVSDAVRSHPTTPSLVLAVARARAAAVEGHRVVIAAADGTAVVVRRSPNGSGFVVISYGLGTWPDQCRRLLDEHG
jgi:hypothetical protein